MNLARTVWLGLWLVVDFVASIVLTVLSIKAIFQHNPVAWAAYAVMSFVCLEYGKRELEKLKDM